MRSVSVLTLALALALAGAPSPLLADGVEENPGASQLDPDYAAGKKAIEAKQWDAANRACFDFEAAQLNRRRSLPPSPDPHSHDHK